MKHEIRFYIIIIMGFILPMTGLLLPPMGIIDNSVLIITGCFLAVAGGIAGSVVKFDFKNLYFFVGDGRHLDNKEIIKEKENVDYEDKPEKTETSQTHSARQ